MDKVQQYINSVLASFAKLAELSNVNTSEELGKEFLSNEMLKIFEALPIHKKAIIQMDNARKERFKRLLEVQDTLRRVQKYDARNMSLMQFIKLKTGVL